MANGTSWRVTGQVTDYQTLSSANEPITGVLVYFITGAGQRGSVLVADDHYDPDTVAAMVGQRAALLDQVAALTSES